VSNDPDADPVAPSDDPVALSEARSAESKGSAHRAATVLAALAAACHGSSPATPTPPACPTTPVIATTQAHVDALRGCTTLAGLSLRGAASLDLTPLAELARIDGDLTAGTTFVLGSIRLPSLTHVGGAVRITSNLDLTGLYLPRLAGAATLTVTDAPALLEIMLPVLADLPGDLHLARLPSLQLVDLSSLPATTPGAFTVENTPQLATWIGATEAQACPSGCPAAARSDP
jgi:hypothetical protein